MTVLTLAADLLRILLPWLAVLFLAGVALYALLTAYRPAPAWRSGERYRPRSRGAERLLATREAEPGQRVTDEAADYARRLRASMTGLTTINDEVH